MATPFGFWTSDALGQTYSITSISPAIGTMGTLVAQNSSAVTVTLSSSGGGFSPSQYVMHSPSAHYSVTVTCVDGSGSSKRCSSHDMVLELASTGSLAGSTRIGSLGNFTIANANQAVISGPSGSGPTTYTLAPLSNKATGTFNVGFGIPLLASGTTGSSTTRTFAVAVGTTNGLSSLLAATLVGTVWNPISVVVNSSLSFGQVLAPVSGTANYTLSPSGALSASGGGAKFASSTATPSAASFTIKGEGAQAFQLTVPSSFDMTGPGGTLTVATITSFGSTTAMTTQTFLGSLGTLGSFPFEVGGLMPVAAGTSSGAYTGSLIISVSYN